MQQDSPRHNHPGDRQLRGNSTSKSRSYPHRPNPQPSPRSFSSSSAIGGTAIHECETRLTSSLTEGPYIRIDYGPMHVDKEMQKKLVDACVRGDVDVADRLIRLGANPNYSEGTVIKPSVYYASRYGHFLLLRRLIERHKCDAYYKTPRGTTLLHLACLHGHEDIVKYLTSPPIRLDPSAKNRLGSTPLHLSCVGGHPCIVQFLIENLHCDPKCIAQLEETPLHTACTKGHLGIMKYLIEVQHCNPSHPTRMGETLLHLACQHGHKDIVIYLITEQHCDPMARDFFQNTPLHSAAQQNHPNIVRYLILEQGCSPHSRNRDNCTPLHLACKYSRINVVKVLLEEAKLNPSIPGPNGQTAIQLTYDHEVVKLLIRHGADPKESQINVFPDIPPQQLEDSIIRMLVVGDPASGKSTLVEALKQPHNPRIFPPFNKNPKFTVEPCTAGIIPHEVKNNPEFGHVLLFDFAGHSEYYSSHSVVIDSVCVSAPIFIIVVDLSKDEERIKLRLHFWVQFIENNRPSFVSQPHIVVVGSHYDVLASQYDNHYKHRILNNIPRFSKKIIEPTSLHFAGFFPINCNKIATQDKLRETLTKSCRSLRAHVQDDSLCHAFSVYLFAMFRGRVMCTVKEVSDVIRQSNSPFPYAMDKLFKLCESLGDKVNIMFIRNPTNIKESTIILEVSTLLSKIQGVMFAPRDFKEHKLASNNGIVTFSRLREVFKGLDPRVIAQCMERLEFCQEIKDEGVLQLITGCESHQDEYVETDGHDEYYFFPCLIDTDHPDKIWNIDVDDRFSYYTGWCLQVSEELQHFPSRFLHALLLRIAFSFAVVRHDSSNSSALNRECNLWKNGIHWFDNNGIESYVELKEDSQVLVLAMRCCSNSEIECIKLRAAVIKKIQETKSTFCPNVAVQEGLIDPTALRSYPLDSIKHCEVPVYSIAMVLKPLIEGLSSTFDISHQHCIQLSKLLYWDPFMNLGNTILKELFNPSLDNVTVSDDFIDEYSQRDFDRFDRDAGHSRDFDNWLILAKKVFQFDKATVDGICRQANGDSGWKYRYLLHQFKTREQAPTYGRLRELFDQFSIFKGRNLFEIAGPRWPPC